MRFHLSGLPAIAAFAVFYLVGSTQGLAQNAYVSNIGCRWRYGRDPLRGMSTDPAGACRACPVETRNTGPCTGNLFLAWAGAPSTPCSGPLREEDIPQTRTCTGDLFLIRVTATQPIGR